MITLWKHICFLLVLYEPIKQFLIISFITDKAIQTHWNWNNQNHVGGYIVLLFFFSESQFYAGCIKMFHIFKFAPIILGKNQSSLGHLGQMFMFCLLSGSFDLETFLWRLFLPSLSFPLLGHSSTRTFKAVQAQRVWLNVSVRSFSPW